MKNKYIILGLANGVFLGALDVSITLHPYKFFMALTALLIMQEYIRKD